MNTITLEEYQAWLESTLPRQPRLHRFKGVRAQARATHGASTILRKLQQHHPLSTELSGPVPLLP